MNFAQNRSKFERMTKTIIIIFKLLPNSENYLGFPKLL